MKFARQRLHDEAMNPDLHSNFSCRLTSPMVRTDLRQLYPVAFFEALIADKIILAASSVLFKPWLWLHLHNLRAQGVIACTMYRLSFLTLYSLDLKAYVQVQICDWMLLICHRKKRRGCRASKTNKLPRSKSCCVLLNSALHLWWALTWWDCAKISGRQQIRSRQELAKWAG